MNTASIQKIQNRPPAWCTLVISILTFALGWTVSIKPAESQPVHILQEKAASSNK